MEAQLKICVARHREVSVEVFNEKGSLEAVLFQLVTYFAIPNQLFS